MGRMGLWRQWVRSAGSTLAGLLLASTLMSGCASSREDFELAERAVGLFHSQFDSEQYSVIYQSADVNLRQRINESDFANLLEDVHRNLGSFQSSVSRFRGISLHSGQRATVRLDYQSAFAQGSGTEQFVWQIRDNQAILYSYKANSKELASK